MHLRHQDGLLLWRCFDFFICAKSGAFSFCATILVRILKRKALALLVMSTIAMTIGGVTTWPKGVNSWPVRRALNRTQGNSSLYTYVPLLSRLSTSFSRDLGAHPNAPLYAMRFAYVIGRCHDELSDPLIVV